MPAGRCEVWVARQSGFAGHEAALERVLVAEELAYVERARHSASTARLSRALLRLLLADHLGLPAAEVGIDRRCPVCTRPHGKPVLAAPEAAPVSRDDQTDPRATLQFSVSHGGDLLVLAFGAGGVVGVDVEPVEPAPPEPGLLELALADAERRRVQEARPEEQSRAFLRLWTAKEAVLKAHGTGLEVPLSSVALPADGAEGRATVGLPGVPDVEFWVREVEVDRSYVCSLATARPVPDLQVRPLTPEVLLAGG